MKPKTSPGPRRDIVTLADLAPQHRVTGGSERRVFGADPLSPNEHSMTASKKATSDLQSKRSDVKGGKKAAR